MVIRTTTTVNRSGQSGHTTLSENCTTDITNAENDISSDGSSETLVKGTIAHDSVDTNDSPVKIGGKAHTVEPVAVASGDIVNAYFDEHGYQITKTQITNLQKAAFGELVIAELTPIVQVQFPYNVNTDILTERHNNGSGIVVDGKLHLFTGAITNQSATILSKRVVAYSPGQGGLIRLTSKFTPGASGSKQLIGLGTSGDGYFWGFNGGTDFGVLRRRGGIPEVQRLTIGTKSSTVENITITLDNDTKTDVAVTNGADATVTANEISSADYSNVGKGWETHVMGNTVTFESYDAAAGKVGTYSLSGASTAVGTFAQSLSGVAPTVEEFVAKEDFNVDKLDGTGMSGFEIDVTKGNVYVTPYQWLGFGGVLFFMENPETAELFLCHIMKYANANTVPSISNPTLPLCFHVENTTNNTNIIMESSSSSGFIQGKITDLGLPRSHATSKSGITTTETPILSIHNHTTHQGVLNRVRMKIKSVDVSVDGTKPTTIRVRLNGELVGGSFSPHNSSISVGFVDTFATSVSNGEALVTRSVAKAGDKLIEFEDLFLNPKDTLTVSVEASNGTTDVVATINWNDEF